MSFSRSSHWPSLDKATNVRRTFTVVDGEVQYEQEAEANALSWKEDGLTIIGATAAKSMAGGKLPSIP